ncbi:MAG: helix-turn-helix domain-containing protein [Cyanobacteria bacterium HKST-UBA02]|nr:helix-turn-helix domain-containing protein [Cyanobacteria bacterium HKST-UBA02]
MSLTLLPPKKAVSQLALMPTKRHRPTLIDADGKETELPAEMLDLLVFVMKAWKQGQGITVSVQSQLVTTQEAANLIGCSRQHVVSLMNSGALPGRKIGTHRRIKLEDVLSFINDEDKRRDQAMDELVELTEEMNGYVNQPPKRKLRK